MHEHEHEKTSKLWWGKTKLKRVGDAKQLPPLTVDAKKGPSKRPFSAGFRKEIRTVMITTDDIDVSKKTATNRGRAALISSSAPDIGMSPISRARWDIVFGESVGDKDLSTPLPAAHAKEALGRDLSYRPMTAFAILGPIADRLPNEALAPDSQPWGAQPKDPFPWGPPGLRPVDVPDSTARFME